MELKIRNAGRRSNIEHVPDSKICDMYFKQKMSMQAIAQEFNVSSATIWRRIHKIVDNKNDQEENSNS